ncbi:Glutathione S-transferase, unnamed subgroup [hydrothermal vent metagenome]|uniref:Glutathione S-transferase, unnamed subgroup n=1 Tax=hydrothermal vent metagenome TaxID=652676 RepID=A0A3B0WV68_9ZZZZ
MIKLYGLDVSGNTYKAKLLMHFLGVNYQFLTLDISQQEHKSPAFLKLNPRGEFPVLEDDSHIIWDSQAILIYLARQYGALPETRFWYPDSAAEIANITQWLCVANNEIFQSLAKARSIIKFNHPGDLALAQKQGQAVLQWIEKHLSHNHWLSNNMPSIADIACYPYIALCEEGKISLDSYSSIQQWLMRIQFLNNYIDMPGLYKPNSNIPEAL